MKRELGSLDWEKLMFGQSASEKWMTFRKQLCSLQSQYITKRWKGRARKIPWLISREAISVIKYKQNSFIKHKRRSFAMPILQPAACTRSSVDREGSS